MQKNINYRGRNTFFLAFLQFEIAGIGKKPVWVGLSCFCLPPENLRVKGFKAMLIECFKDNFDMKLTISTSEKNPTKGPIAVKIHVHLGKQRAQIFSSKWKALGHSLTVHTLKRCWQPSSRSL